jgi:hypothetical protein
VRDLPPGSEYSPQAPGVVPVIATYTGRCPICDGRIIAGRSRVGRLSRPVHGRRWAHQRCADQQPIRVSSRALADSKRPRKDLE